MLPFVSRWPELRSRWVAVERWVLPGACLLCREPVESLPSDPLVCAPCRYRWSAVPEPSCGRCGQPLTAGIPCRLCAAWPTGLGGVRSAVWLEDGARQAVHRLKYAGWWRIAETMADTIWRRIPVSPEDTLIPIPLGRTRQRSRGYNQSAVLARALARLARCAVNDSVLLRRRETTTQTALTPEERRVNLTGAFRALGSLPRRIVLVDDVFTTGATLAEAATALLAAGAESVSGITFARAPRLLAEASVGVSGTGQQSTRSRA